MKFVIIAVVICALCATIATVQGKRAAVRSDEENSSMLSLLKQGLGQFLVNGLESVKTLLSGSTTWRGMIYLNGKDPYDDYEYDAVTDEKSEVLQLLYILVKQVDLLLKHALASKRNDAIEDEDYEDEGEYDEEEYYDYGWPFGGNVSNKKDADDDDDDDDGEYDTYDFLNYLNGNDDDDDDDDEYDEDEDDSGYADRDDVGDDDYEWYSLFGSGGGDGNDDDEDYDKDYDKEIEKGDNSEQNTIKTESTVNPEMMTLPKPTETVEKETITKTSELNEKNESIEPETVKQTGAEAN